MLQACFSALVSKIHERSSSSKIDWEQLQLKFLLANRDETSFGKFPLQPVWCDFDLWSHIYWIHRRPNRLLISKTVEHSTTHTVHESLASAPSNPKEFSLYQFMPRDVQQHTIVLPLLSNQDKDPVESVGCRFTYCWLRSLRMGIDSQALTSYHQIGTCKCTKEGLWQYFLA